MRMLITLLVCLLATRSLANDLVSDGDFRTCLAQQATAGAPVIECVIKAHAPCDTLLPDTQAGQACYEAAKQEWGDRLSSLLDSFSDRPAELQQAARIEAKYSVITNMLNCDMRMELAHVERGPQQEDQFEQAQCEAVAAAASLTEVLFKSGTVVKGAR